jgi:CRP/FNR family cyclic AMP-dependent transcriptional regulator
MEVEVIARFLVASDLQLTPEAADALAARMWTIELDRGEFLCLQGEPADRFFMVFSGELMVQASSSEGRELVFTSLPPGAPIGEVSIFDAVPRTAAIRAARRSRVLAVGRDTFLELLHDHPSLSIGIARQLAANVRRLSGNVEGVSFLPLRARLAELLLRLADEGGHSGDGVDRLEVAATQQALADRLGSSRESVNKTLAALSAAGSVAVRRGRVEIIDRGALEGEARTDAPTKSETIPRSVKHLTEQQVRDVHTDPSTPVVNGDAGARCIGGTECRGLAGSRDGRTPLEPAELPEGGTPSFR